MVLLSVKKKTLFPGLIVSITWFTAFILAAEARKVMLPIAALRLMGAFYWRSVNDRKF